MPGFICIDMVKDGRKLQADDVYDAYRWWVVAVLDRDGLWCVYGGGGDTVLRCLAEHNEYNEITQAVAFPFEDGQESNQARTQIETNYRRKSREDSHNVVERRGPQHARRTRGKVPA